MVSGQCLFTISDGPPAIPLVQGGKTRALAVTGSERSPQLPERAEHGGGRLSGGQHPSVERLLRAGRHAGTGGGDKLTAELGRALADPGVQDGLKKMAVKPGGPTGDAFKKFIDADIKTFADVVKAAKLTFKQ